MSFYPGQLVVCVNDDWTGSDLGLSDQLAGVDLPKKSVVYTVVAIEPPLIGDKYIVHLEEISLPEVTVTVDGGEIWCVPGFEADHFRPLDEKRLDIFRAHLAPLSRKGEPA